MHTHVHTHIDTQIINTTKFKGVLKQICKRTTNKSVLCFSNSSSHSHPLVNFLAALTKYLTANRGVHSFIRLACGFRIDWVPTKLNWSCWIHTQHAQRDRKWASETQRSVPSDIFPKVGGHFPFELQHSFSGLVPIGCFETLQVSLENLVVLRFLKLQCNATLYYDNPKGTSTTNTTNVTGESLHVVGGY